MRRVWWSLSVGAAALWAAFHWIWWLGAIHYRATFDPDVLCWDCAPNSDGDLAFILALATLALGQLVMTWRARRGSRSAYAFALLCGSSWLATITYDKIYGWTYFREPEWDSLTEFLWHSALSEAELVLPLLAWLIGNAIWLRPGAWSAVR